MGTEYCGLDVLDFKIENFPKSISLRGRRKRRIFMHFSCYVPIHATVRICQMSGVERDLRIFVHKCIMENGVNSKNVTA